MESTLAWLKKIFSKANIWEFAIGAAIALNLFRYHAVDIFFVLFALMAIIKIKTVGLPTVFNDLHCKPSPLTYLTLTFFIGCSAGYLWFWPLNEEQISDVLQLRWILGLYFCIYAGSQVGKLPTNFHLRSTLPLALLAYLLYMQTKEPFGFIDIRNRMWGFYENPNHFGMTLALIWSVYLGFLTFAESIRTKAFVVLGLTLLGISVALIATYSRSSWMGCAIALLIAIAYSRRKFLIGLAALGATFCASIIATNAFGIRDRLLSTNFSSAGVESGRIAIWKVSWQIFLDYPLFGVGIDQGKRIYQEYYERMGIPLEYLVGHAHNQYLQLLAGAGLVGFLSYIGLFALALVYFHRILRSDANENLKQVALGGTLLIVALFVSSLTDAPFRLQECRNYVLLYLGFAYGYLKTKQNEVLK